ncbi:hypothetical protein ACFQ08_37100, partial [Streptosporangium algeriense]
MRSDLGEGVWREVRGLIAGGKARKLADRVAALSEVERAEVARRLPEFLEETRQAAIARVRANREDEVEWLRWEEREAVGDVLTRLGPSLRIAGAGTISGA